MVDEADRLLLQSYHSWLPKVLSNMFDEHAPTLVPDSSGCD